MAFSLFIWWVGELLLGFQTEHIAQVHISFFISNTLIIAIGMWMTLQACAKSLSRDELKYGTLMISAGVNLMAMGFLVFAFSLVFYKMVNPAWTQTMVDANMAVLTDTDVETLDKKRKAFNAIYSASSMGMKHFSRIVFIGFFLMLVESAIVLLIAKRRQAS